MKAFAILAVLILAALGALPSLAATIQVPQDQQTIQAGIDASQDGDTVLVADGQYNENINFNGKNIAVIGNPEHPENVVIDGGGNGPVITADNGENETCLLQGFAITNGSGIRLVNEIGVDNLGRGIAYAGGGIFLHSSIHVADCRILRNSVTTDEPIVGAFGGGVYAVGNPLFERCEFVENEVRIRGNYSGQGSALCFNGRSPRMIECNIHDHLAGAAIYLVGTRAQTIIQDCEINQNYNGILGMYSASFSLVNSVLRGNRCAVEIEANSTATIDSCTISNNQNGAIVAILECELLVRNSFINYAGQYSGGIAGGLYFDNTANIIFENCVVGPGVCLEAYTATVDMINCTIAMNSSGPGSVFIRHRSSVNLDHSVIWSDNLPQILFSAENGFNNMILNIAFCDLRGGRDSIIVNNGGAVNWGPGNIDADPLFLDPDNGDFRLSPESPCIDTGDPDSPHDPDGTVADMGAYYAHHFTIQLREGWQIISSPVPPPNPDIRTIWAPLVDRGYLVLTKNIQGQFYNPGARFSNMTPWDVHFGYLAKINAGVVDSLRFFNQPVEVTEPIPLRQGWSIAAYYPEANLTAPQAFAGIANVLDLAKDAQGHFYRPAIGFSNMGTLSRGKGYMVRARQATELVWGNGQRQMMMRDDDDDDDVDVDVDGIREGLSTLVHFVHPEETGRNMSVVVTPPPTPPASGGEWEIGVFTKDGLCVGSSSSSSSPIGIAVWGDDPTTDAIDGAVEGEELSFRVWDGTVETPVLLKVVETTVLPTVPPQGLRTLRANVASGCRDPEAAAQGDERQAGRLSYATDGFAELTLAVGAQGLAPLPTAFSLAEAYPNPFNGSTRISFGVPQDAAVTVGIYDLGGRLVNELASGRVSAGVHSVTWNAEGVPSGLYLVKMHSGGFDASRKMVLAR